MVKLLLFAYTAIIGSSNGEKIQDSYIRDNVRPEDFKRLTPAARNKKTHLSGSGSGFFITNDGYLLTNHHVIDGAKEIVIVQNEIAYFAKVEAKNKKSDLALLKINLFPRATNGVIIVNGIPETHYLRFADKCQLGQGIYAIGFPLTEVLGCEPKVTRGIISSMTGYKGSKDQFQMDASIQHGNSGGPVIDEFGGVVGVASAGIFGLGGGNFNYAVTLEAIRRFLPDNVKVGYDCGIRKLSVEKLFKAVKQALVLVLRYDEGACDKIDKTVVNTSDSERRETETYLRKAKLNAQILCIRKDWNGVYRITENVMRTKSKDDEIIEMNDRAREELGLHLTIIAEADDKEVAAKITPITGFKDSKIVCGETVTLCGRDRHDRKFPVEAVLDYEDDKWLWRGTIKCQYDWHGTREIRVVMKHVGVKGAK